MECFIDFPPLIKVIISHVRLFIIISHVTIMADNFFFLGGGQFLGNAAILGVMGVFFI